MLAAVGFPVKSLERTGIGPLRLKGVARGAWRELTAAEIKGLRRAAASATGEQEVRTDPTPKKKAPDTPKKTAKRPSGSKRGRPQAEEELAPTQLSRKAVKNAAHGRPNPNKPARGGDG